MQYIRQQNRILMILFLATVLLLPIPTSPLCAPIISPSSNPASSGSIKNGLVTTASLNKQVTIAPTAANSETSYLSLVMVGDTGFAPSGAAPLSDRVYKHGRKLTFEETLKFIGNDINGHVNFANIETIITSSAKLAPYPKKYNFQTHPNGIRQLVKSGFNLFSLANNHAFDYGRAGILETLHFAKKLRSDGLLAYAGIGEDRQQAAHTPVFSARNMQIAFGAIGIGAGTGGLERAGKNRPGQLALFNQSDQTLLTDNLRQATADLRLLSIHQGPERISRPSANEVYFKRSLAMASNADVIIGHHAHIARGLELMKGRLIVYGLGNFNHQGTANMNDKGGCHDFSLIVRAHFVRKQQSRPQLAAIEVLPINSTHMQPTRISGKEGARRIAILNGLSKQFDNKKTGSRGIRLMAQTDGSGLFCTSFAKEHPYTHQLCSHFSLKHVATDAHYRRAVASCGRSAPLKMIARAAIDPDLQKTAGRQPVKDIPADADLAISQIGPTLPLRKPYPAPSLARSASAPGPQHGTATDTRPTERKAIDHAPGLSAKNKTETRPDLPRRLEANPAHWPAGIPLAWVVPDMETPEQKQARWTRKRYSVAEVERLLRKQNLIK
ncbi:CapA family protein [uncultured Cohaesibacter sp.]|uniref:CapA family protein n=1 Tax=uncultured Cohaesibacter sp. TaxID=1002546 RepID=UPI00292DDC2D|nr:CapA family protein [uncultured Cohaesibacter sp.]